MNIPQIKTPSPDTPLYKESDYYRDREQGVNQNTFGYVFYDTYEKNLDLIYNRVMSKRKSTLNKTPQEVCDITNEFERLMREEIDTALRDFLITNNGVIDAWPDCFSFFTISTEKHKDGEVTKTDDHFLVFDYFGAKYVPDPNSLLKDCSREAPRALRFDRYDRKERFEKAISKAKRLKAEIALAKKNPFEKFKSFICYLPTLYFALADILLIFGAIFGIAAIRETVGPLVPFYMFLSSVDGYSMIHFVFMPFVGGIITAFLKGIIDPQVADVKSLAEQTKLHDDYINSDEYLNATAEGVANETAYNSQTEKWHQEWLDATMN